MLCNLDSTPDQTGWQKPSASESGYSRDAIFSRLHFDILGDFSIFFPTFKRPRKRFYFDWVALLQRKEQKYFFLLRKKKVGPSLFRICVEWDVWRFVWVSLLFCIYSINIYININCCTLHSEPSLHARGFPTSPNAFCSSVWISWWIHSCFCLMNANSCNMQELWPGNKNDCTCAASVMCCGSLVQNWICRITYSTCDPVTHNRTQHKQRESSTDSDSANGALRAFIAFFQGGFTEIKWTAMLHNEMLCK